MIDYQIELYFRCVDVSENINMDDTSVNKNRKIDGDSKPKSVYPFDQRENSPSKLSNLKKHKQTKHKGIGYPCDQCDYTANNQDAL